MTTFFFFVFVVTFEIIQTISDIVTRNGSKTFVHDHCFKLVLNRVFMLGRANKGADIKFQREIDFGMYFGLGSRPCCSIDHFAGPPVAVEVKYHNLGPANDKRFQCGHLMTAWTGML